MSINFIADVCPHLGFFSSLCFGQISPLAVFWGYGYKTQHSLSEVAVNLLKTARGEICPKRSEKSNKR